MNIHMNIQLLTADFQAAVLEDPFFFFTVVIGLMVGFYFAELWRAVK